MKSKNHNHYFIAAKPGVNTEVISGGKLEGEYEKDIANNIARFGGGRKPNYTLAYLRAARTLVNQATQTYDLDQLALPIFYLHRHTVELFLKHLLWSLDDLASLRHECYEDETSRENIPSENQLKTWNNTHDLASLYKDLENLAIKLSYDNLPGSIKELPELINKYEITETWSRYPFSGKNEKIRHTKNEVELPIVEIHETIEKCINSLGTFEDEIYRELNSLMTLINDPN
jgi:hypothetical protein